MPGITNFQFKIKSMAVVLGDRRLSPSGVGEVQAMRTAKLGQQRREGGQAQAEMSEWHSAWKRRIDQL